MKRPAFILSLFIMLLAACTANNTSSSVEIHADDISTHITFLASDEMKGREAGTPEEAAAANYIADLFKSYDVQPAGDDGTYFQTFTFSTARLTNPHAAASDTSGERRMAKNVVGFLPGISESDELIIIGAHYDHLGLGAFGSLYKGEPKIHNGADDNASGTAGLLELAEYFAVNRPNKNLLFIAFSAEEMGLLGSQYYVENPTVELEQAIAMINMDMIGRMSDNRLMIFGTGTADSWESILTDANIDSLKINLVPDGTGASDHTSFYYKDIPVLHYFTDTHADYHRPSDDADYINYEGQELVVKHVARVVETLDTMNKSEMVFIPAPGQQQSVAMSGPTLGILPDYGYDGKGMKITGVTEGRAAANAGLKGGDIIVGISGNELADIYDYMKALNTLTDGQKTTITIIRDGKELILPLQL